MGIDVSHLVLVSFCDADDEVVDYRPYRTERCDIFSGPMVDLDLD